MQLFLSIRCNRLSYRLVFNDTHHISSSVGQPIAAKFENIYLLSLLVCFAQFHILKQMIIIYQSPLILTELFKHNLINVSYLTACYLYQVMMTLHFLNDVAYYAESTQKSKLPYNR